VQSIYFRSIHQNKLQSIERVKKGAWINVVTPEKEELAEISSKYGFDLDLLNDGIDLYEAPRLEHEDNVTYIYIRYSLDKKLETSTEPLLIVVTTEMIMTVARNEAEPIKKLIDGESIITYNTDRTLIL
jgi:Mg2+ and Co2+ transporter CorA